MRTQSCDAQLVKAEAEYNLCHFEHALVTYYKGNGQVSSPSSNTLKRPGPTKWQKNLQVDNKRKDMG